MYFSAIRSIEQIAENYYDEHRSSSVDLETDERVFYASHRTERELGNSPVLRRFSSPSL